MIEGDRKTQTFFGDEELSKTLELSRQQFRKALKSSYGISDDRILEALKHINESDDYAKVVWRAQQDNADEEKFFDVEYLAGALTSLKMFYSLEVIDGKNLHSLSKELDAFWHAHQDFTFDYINFCNKVFGAGQFLHHLPLDQRSEEQQQIIGRRYDYTRSMLEKVYNFDRRFWGEGAPICCSYESPVVEGFVFWKPAMIAMEPPCSLFNDSRSNEEIRKRTNLVLESFA